MNILIKNIKELIQTEVHPKPKVEGKAMAQLSTLQNAWLLIEGEHIAGYGTMENMPSLDKNLKVIDATGKMVFPCWCDPHTHLVFSHSRENEFVDRIKGLSYEDIAKKGGGILNSAKRMQMVFEEQLLEAALERLNEIMKTGTGAVEIKSGYGLSLEGEIKMLKVIKKLKKLSPLTIKATFLGAHAFPAEYKNNHGGYIDIIINEMLPVIKEQCLADYIDVFCEKGYYSVEETERILDAGISHGLIPKIHVNQFNVMGCVQTGIKYNALSVDHLEVIHEKDIVSLKNNRQVMPTLLPSCSFFLNLPYSPARKLIDANIGVALATDYNPGSTPSGNIPFVLSLACIKMKMTPEEAIHAATINAAYAMGISNSHGSIAKEKTANIFITKKIPSYSFIPYSFGNNPIETVIIKGKVVCK